MYGTILGQEGASLNPGFAKKHDFHKFSVFVKRNISWSHLERVIPYPTQPRSCSLMVKKSSSGFVKKHERVPVKNLIPYPTLVW